MKRAIAAIILAAVIMPVQASDAVCTSLYDMVVRIGKSRDRGVPMASLMTEAETNFSDAQLKSVVKQIIVAVYTSPEVPIVNAAAAAYNGCSKSNKNRGGV